jgi:hypothetical protein
MLILLFLGLGNELNLLKGWLRFFLRKLKMNYLINSLNIERERPRKKMGKMMQKQTKKVFL